MTDRLKLYNRALLYCSERPLVTLEDNTPPRRTLDAVWDGGAVDEILENGLWNCAIRTAKIEYTGDIEPSFGYRRAFTRPDDWLRTAAVSAGEYFNPPLRQYADEGGYWYADYESIYVKYVSNHGDYGGDLGGWPPSLTEAAARWLASKAAHGFNRARVEIGEMEAAAERAFVNARSKDAQRDATKFMPEGSWIRSRRGSRGSGRDGGIRTSLN